MRGSGFEFSRSVIVRERVAREVRRKLTGYVLGHNSKIEECLPQKLCNILYGNPLDNNLEV